MYTNKQTKHFFPFVVFFNILNGTE